MSQKTKQTSKKQSQEQAQEQQEQTPPVFSRLPRLSKLFRFARSSGFSGFPYGVPVFILGGIFILSLWNGAKINRETDRWCEQLQQLDAQIAQTEDWTTASLALDKSYQDWSQRQTYLHIAAEHSAVNNAEVLYQRARAFAQTQELSEFRAEISNLCEQLRLLAEMEQLSIRNIL